MIPIIIPPKEEFDKLCKVFNASWLVIKNNLLEIRMLEVIKANMGSLKHGNAKGA